MSDGVTCAEHLLRNAHKICKFSKGCMVILENIIAKTLNLWHPRNLNTSKICTYTVVAILCKSQPITAAVAGEWLNSLVFYDDIKRITANG